MRPISVCHAFELEEREREEKEETVAPPMPRGCPPPPALAPRIAPRTYTGRPVPVADVLRELGYIK